MIDRYNRVIDYLRISVTDRCDLRCIYCMPADGVPALTHEELLTYEEILRLCRVFASLGLKKVRLTGGEPLVRKDLGKLVADLKSIEGIQTVGLTTNGMALLSQLPELLAAGLDAVNISIDALDEDIFQMITRRRGVNRVKAAIAASASVPNFNVKLNCVPQGMNDSQLIPIAALAEQFPLSVRFIELMPIGLGRQLTYRSEDEVRNLLEGSFGRMIPCAEHLGNGPCHYFEIPGFQGKIGFISAISHKFCHQCNRVRLTSSGFLKTCLQYDIGVDLKRLLRSGCSDDVLRTSVELSVFHKPVCHQFTGTAEERHLEQHIMSQIGG